MPQKPELFVRNPTPAVKIATGSGIEPVYGPKEVARAGASSTLPAAARHHRKVCRRYTRLDGNERSSVRQVCFEVMLVPDTGILGQALCSQ